MRLLWRECNNRTIQGVEEPDQGLQNIFFFLVYFTFGIEGTFRKPEQIVDYSGYLFVDFF